MNFIKANIIANDTAEGISIIDIILYSEKGGRCSQSAQLLIDSLNSMSTLDRFTAKSIVSKQYNIPSANVSFQV